MRAFILVWAILSLSTPAAGQTVCGKPATRYLDVVAVRTVRSSLLQDVHSFGTAFVFADGSHLSSEVSGLSFHGSPISASQGQIARATSSASFAGLRQAADAARVGIQGPCRLVHQTGEELSYIVKWYGRNGRVNRFGVSSEFEGPECSPEVAAFVGLLLSYVNPASSPGERFVTP